MTTPTTVQVQIQLRADTAANWTSEDPTLLANEVGLETDTKKLKVGNGTTAWTSLAYFPSIVTGGTVLGNLEIGTTGTLTFEGSTANGFETTLAVTDPTADRTITLPDQSGTVVVTGNASIVDADIAANAEIAVSKLADGAARQLLQTDAAGTGVEWTSNVDIPGTLDVTGAATFDGNVTIAGDLTVNGTTTTINTQDLLVEDKNIIIGNVDTPDDTTANNGGITLKGTTDKTINWLNATDSWTSSENIDLANGKSYRINDTEVLSATTLGSGVTSSSLTSVGTIGSGTWQGTAIDASYLDSTVVTTSDTGTVTSTMIADGTIVNADINSAAAIAHSKLANITAGSVLLGNASNVPTATALSGDVTVDSSGVTAIGSGVVVDADISASAEIAVSKLADGAARQLLQTDAAGTGVEWTDNVDIPGTLDVTGATTLDGDLTIPDKIIHAGDTDTTIRFSGADTVAVETAGTERVEFGTNEVVFNDGGEDIDFRIEGDTNSALFFVDAGAEAIGIGTTTFTANGGILELSGGITFPATAVAAGNANTLDDYEEGTWTPTIVGATTAGTATYTAQSGRYTKIGRIVYIQAYVSWNSGTGTGFLRITGLPFTSENNASNFAAVSLGNVDINGTAGNILLADIIPNVTYVRIGQYPTGGGTGTLVNYDAIGNAAITGMYFV